jgi:hypothetical protein
MTIPIDILLHRLKNFKKYGLRTSSTLESILRMVERPSWQLADLSMDTIRLIRTSDANTETFHRPILNIAHRGKLWPQGRSCPLWVNFALWGWSYPPGGEVRPSIIHNSGECSTLGVNEEVNISPRGQIAPLRVKLRMTLRGRFM